MDKIISIETPQFPKLSYRKSGEGPAIVLIHGFPENGELWRNVWQSFDGFTLLIPDLPGSGNSEYRNAEEVTMEYLANSIYAILQHEKLNNAVIVGHSMGGYVALAFAKNYPDMVAGLCLVHSVATADDEEKKENRRKAISVVEKGGREVFIKQMVPNLFAPKFRDAHPALVEQQIEGGLKLKAEAIAAFYNAMMNRENLTGILNNADFPVGWVLGREDSVIPAEKALQQTTRSNVNFVYVYAHTGHMSMIEQPEKLVKDLKQFAEYCYKETN